MATTFERVRKLVAEVFGVEEKDVILETPIPPLDLPFRPTSRSNQNRVAPGASFVEDFGADSLDIVEFVMALEEEFAAQLADEDAESLRPGAWTVGDLVRYLDRHMP